MLNIRRHPITSALTLIIVSLASWVAPGVPREAHAGQEKPDLSAIRFYSQAELMGVQQSVFESLFLQPWDVQHWEYPLDAEEVGGRGIYTGKNQYGQPFELHIKVFAQANLDQAGMTPALRQWARENEFVFRGVMGELVHQDVRLSVHGQVVSTRAADGRTNTRFWLTNTLTPDHPIVDVAADDPMPRPDARRGLEVGPPLDEPIFQNDEGDCLAKCHGSRNRSINRANQQFDITVAAAKATETVAINAANQTYQNALMSAETTRDASLLAATTAAAACSTACLLGAPSPPAVAACVALCASASATAAALAQVIYNDAVQTAQANRVSAINAAVQTYNTAYDAANASRNLDIEQANDDFTTCARACNPPQPQPGGAGPVQLVPQE